MWLILIIYLKMLNINSQNGLESHYKINAQLLETVNFVCTSGEKYKQVSTIPGFKH